MVAISDFSGLASSACAFASAAAIAPIDSLARCMALLHRDKIKADRAGLRALGPYAVARGFLRIVGHQPFEFGFGSLMFEEGGARRTKHPGEFRPGIGPAHI